MKRILMAEDEENISDFVSRGLKNFDFEVTVVSTGDAAWRLLAEGNRYDLVMLDIRMPGMSGLEVCRQIRETFGYQTPVLMLTALDTTDDIVMGLHVGADDYMAKPFKFIELVARIQALIRRSETQKDRKCLQCSGLRLDAASHKAIRGEQEFELIVKEFRLLQYMMEHEGEVLSRRQLMKDVWDKDFDTRTNVVDVYVRYLRQKIDENQDVKLIQTVVGVGYCFRSDEDR